MKVLLFILAALVAYMVGGINPSIELSKRIYHTDVRQHGSGNAGLANFKRTFGNKWSWLVLLADLGKAAVVVAVFAGLFERYMDAWQLGAVYTGLFAMIGHAYPIWYKFKGGKCIVVFLSVIWFIDWRAGIISVAVLLILLFTVRYFSLADMCGVLSCPITLLFVGAESPWVIVLSFVSVLLIFWRHKGNIKRLIKGTEPKFRLKAKGTIQDAEKQPNKDVASGNENYSSDVGLCENTEEK